MKKILLTCILLICLTGCNIDYNININDDFSYSENASIVEIPEYYEENIIEGWNEILTEYNGKVNNGDKVNISLEKTTEKINKIKKNKYIDKFVGDITFSEGSTYIIKIKFNNAAKTSLYGGLDYPASVEYAKLNITLPFKVISSNATEVNGNTLTWIFDSKDKDSIELEFENPHVLLTFFKYFGLVLLVICAIGVVPLLIYFKYKKVNAF